MDTVDSGTKCKHCPTARGHKICPLCQDFCCVFRHNTAALCLAKTSWDGVLQDCICEEILFHVPAV